MEVKHFAQDDRYSTMRLFLRPLGMLLAVTLVVACSEDDEQPALQRVTIELAACASPIEEADTTAPATSSRLISPITRSADPAWVPSGFHLYENLTGANGVLESNVNKPIGVFLTQDNNTVQDLKFSPGSGGTWRIDKEITGSAGTYQLYGFVPYNVATVTIAPNSTYADGAVLTLTNLNSVMSEDLCFVVGAKDGIDENTVNGTLLPGNFDCLINVGSGSANHLFLLFDHLYAALSFRFRVDETYAALRTIRIKRLELEAYADEACTQKMTKLVSTSVTLRKNVGSSPVVRIADFTTVAGSGDMDPVEFFSGEKVLPSGKDANDNYIYTENIGFVPKTSSYYKLKTTYDVYDNDVSRDPKGNLVRKDCIAFNMIDPRRQFNQSSLDRGKMYTLRITVKPTYLYVLSDPDLDNPTLTIED